MLVSSAHGVLASLLALSMQPNAPSSTNESPTSTQRSEAVRDVIELASQLNSGDFELRRAASAALMQQGEAARHAAVQLAIGAGDVDETVREHCVASLEELGPPLPSDVDVLARLTATAPADTVYWAATLIGRAGTANAEVVDHLMRSLGRQQDSAARERIAWALGKIGRAAQPAVATLRHTAEQPNCTPRLRRLCLHSITAIGNAED